MSGAITPFTFAPAALSLSAMYFEPRLPCSSAAVNTNQIVLLNWCLVRMRAAASTAATPVALSSAPGASVIGVLDVES